MLASAKPVMDTNDVKIRLKKTMMKLNIRVGGTRNAGCGQNLKAQGQSASFDSREMFFMLTKLIR